MTTFFQNVRRLVRGRNDREIAVTRVQEPERRQLAITPAIEIAPNDPLIAYFLSVPGTVGLEKLRLESPALAALHVAGVKLVVPLVSQGDLIGLLSLGPRMSQQEYSSDDRGLLNNLATQAAPAVRVAQLVRQQQLEALQRERIEQELRVAQLVQQTLLPKAIPSLAGYQIDRCYQPARAVGGDFYDFIALPDQRMGLVIGHVTDKGVPAALVMATTRSLLRAAGRPARIARHGNHTNPMLLVEICVRASATDVLVEIVDQGDQSAPIGESETPDIYAKLDGEQSPRGWGLFLIKSMVDDMRVSSDERHHRIELIMHLEGASNAGQIAGDAGAPTARRGGDRLAWRDQRGCCASAQGGLCPSRAEQSQDHIAHLQRCGLYQQHGDRADRWAAG